MFGVKIVVAIGPWNTPGREIDSLCSCCLRWDILGRSYSGLTHAQVSAGAFPFGYPYGFEEQNQHWGSITPAVEQGKVTLEMAIECPKELVFQLWRDMMHSLCPSWRLHTQLGHFKAPTHKIWWWTWDDDSGFLCHASDNGTTKEIFIFGRKLNRFHYSHTRPSGISGTVFSVEPTHASSGWWLTTLALAAILTPTPKTFLDVLHSWSNTWLWDNILITGGFNWLHEAIRDGTLVAVTDGSYIHKLYPNLCLATFVIECKEDGGDWLVHSQRHC